MQPLRRTWFISDLHLDEKNPEITSQFIRLLEDADHSVDDIYILGDLFETWIGDDDQSAFHQSILTALHDAVKRGTNVHIMHGNRDFLLGRRFTQETGCHFLSDPVVISVYSTPVLLMHGDTLCTRDVDYLRARKFMRNPVLQTIFLLLPLSWRQKIALRAREASEKHTRTTSMEIMDVTHDEVARMMQKFKVDYLIHGHTHRPDVHRFSVDSRDKTRIVLPAWHNGGSVFEWRSDGGMGLINL